LNYLFREMLGELSVGHLFVFGGDIANEPKRVRGGLLGADYKLENGRYRFARVYEGDNWSASTRAPLTQPGVSVRNGEYLLKINGVDLRDTDNVYARLEGTAGKSVQLTVGPNADGSGSRDVTVVPTDNEVPLRQMAWVEDNRKRVSEASGGKLAYMHLPDTAGGGYRNFNRYYFSQTDRQGAVIDERFNHGGQAADYIIDHLRRPVWSYWTSREGEIYTTPGMLIQGPKVMVANEYSGSGGDLLPWLFKRAKLGPVIGKRTWGGLVGIGGYPSLIDGGAVTAPHFAFFTPEGKWEVENHGTDVDVDVDLDPKAWREGRDTQLEKAIDLAMAELKKNPIPSPKKPEYPNYQQKPVATGGGH
jgi:tricorn protease